MLLPSAKHSRQHRYSPASTEHPQLLLYSFKEFQQQELLQCKHDELQQRLAQKLN